MSEEENKDQQQPQQPEQPESPQPEAEPQAQAEPASGDAKAVGGMPVKMKYLIMGGGGLIVVLLAIIVVMLFSGRSETVSDAAQEPESAVVEESHEAQTHADEASDDHATDDHTAHQETPAEAPSQSHAMTTPEAPHENPAELPTQQQLIPPAPEDDSLLTMLASESDFMDEIQKSLEMLDYDPSKDASVALEGMEGDEAERSREDSIEQVNWLKKEKAALAEKEADLARREKELSSLDRKVSQKLLKLEQAESARVANLARLYDGMDPRSVAKLMAQLDDDTVVSILPRMKLKNASQVLALMPSVRAARLSKQMITITE